MEQDCPMQPLERKDGVIRFRPNRVVVFLLRYASRCVAVDGGLDLNYIAAMAEEFGWPQTDLEQFWMLMGYSVSGFGELSFVRTSTIEMADVMAEKF